MTVNEYALKFSLLSKYAPSLVASPKDLMNRFMTGVSDLVEEECRIAMHVDNMDISHLMVFSQQIEESKVKKDRAREKKRQGFSNAPMYNDERVSTPRPQGKGSESLWPTCSRCCKKHDGKCLVGRDGCYGCGESGHMKKDCPKAKATIREGKQVAPSGGDDDPPKRNRFYALQSREGQE
ncbi:uncharacterized protein LOC125825729 [Solanum verrucosum]|uniref:uncharacterized protein LOC125825729 n=1 Tax=Solanum verrucosum TaxID=315347 RepID=UPI0020D16A37|nr:uncharacterized protein LOC125825729 [Solanum verrucosum]